MLLKKVLKGHFRVKSISVRSGDYPEDMIEIHFHRCGRWSIFGWRKHRNHTYVRKNASKYVETFRYKCHRCYPFGFYTSKNWLLQFHTPSLSEIVYKFLMDNLLYIYILYVLVYKFSVR